MKAKKQLKRGKTTEILLLLKMIGNQADKIYLEANNRVEK